MFRSNVKVSYLRIRSASCIGLVLLISGCNQLRQEQVSPLTPYPDLTEPDVVIDSPLVKDNPDSSVQADKVDANNDIGELNEIYEADEIRESNEIKEALPKKTVQNINWPASLQLLNKQLVQSADLPPSSIKVLVDDIKNNTKINVDLQWLSQILGQQLSASSRFLVIDTTSVSQARKILELDRQDSLKTRTKSMAVARHLKAPYILFTSIMCNNDHPEITMQLMQMSTGELLWSQTDKTIKETIKK